MPQRNSFLKSTLFVSFGRFVGLIFGFLFTPLLIRVLSKEEYGVFAAAFALFGIFKLVSTGGLFDSVRKHIAEAKTEGKQTTVLSTGYLLGLVYSLVTIGLVYVIAIRIFDPNQAHLLVLFSVALVGVNLLDISKSAFHGRQQEQYAMLFHVLQRLIYLIAGVGLAVFYQVEGVIIGYIVSMYIAAVLGLVFVHRHFEGLIVRVSRTKEDFEPVAKYGAAQLVGGLAAGMLYKADILLIDYFLVSTATAAYQAALVLAEFIWFIPRVVQTVVLQNVATHWSKGNIERINTNLSGAMKWTLLVLILVSIGLFGLADPFVVIYYGQDYANSATPLRILLLGTVLYGIARIFIPALQATGMIVYTELMTVIALVINIGLNWWLIPIHGIVGAAVATSVSYSLMVVGGLFLWKYTEMSFGSVGFFVRAGISTALFAVPYLTVIELLTLPPVQMLIVCPPLGLALFLAASTLTGTITKRDYRRIWSIVQTRL
jgi:O-antigen/teichoic acid export membrane protein